MMTQNKTMKVLNEREKQVLPMPGEVTAEDAKVGVFIAMQKAKQKTLKRKG